MINYQYNKEDNILYAKYSGFVSTSEIKDFFDKIYLDETLPKELFILQDERNAKFDNADINISQAIDSISRLTEKFNLIVVAIIQITPIETAYSILFKNTISIKNYIVEIYYSRHAALNWLRSIINKRIITKS